MMLFFLLAVDILVRYRLTTSGGGSGAPVGLPAQSGPAIAPVAETKTGSGVPA